MKLASIVVAYNPNVEDVIRNTLSFAWSCDLVILWDNSVDRNNDWSPLNVLGDKLIVYQENENVGLAKAYNWGIEQALSLNCTHIMTMDQDSCFEGFDVLRNYVAQYDGAEFGMFCPPIKNPCTTIGTVVEVNDAAQSGCIFSLEMINCIGGFREDFFIGMVDVEIQLRAAERGFKIAQVGGCNLIHQIGSGRVVKLLGKSCQVSDYSPLRHYYDSRNRILMWHEFPYDYDFKLKMRHYLGRLKLCMKILLFEDKKMSKVNAIVRGTINGLLDKVITY